MIDAVTAYDDSDTLESLMAVPGFPEIARGQLYDAIRMCSVDGPLTAEERDHLERAADEMGIAPWELDELCAIVGTDARLRHRRFNAVVAPVLPNRPLSSA